MGFFSLADGAVHLYEGDCLEILPTLRPVDAVVTDPPYHLTSIVKRFGAKNAAPCKTGATGAYKRHSTGFMGKKWDGGDIAFQPETWKLCLNVLKPGGHMLVFGGSRTFHRVACAIEDAGFEIRDTIMWIYGSGFPKSHNLKDQWEGWGTALKPAHEPIILARKSLSEKTIAANVLEHGTGALNIDRCRIEKAADDRHEYGIDGDEPSRPGLNVYGKYTERRTYTEHSAGRWPANVIHDGSDEVIEAFGAATRFFYCAKASKKDRQGSKHPTVKPIKLIEYLIQLITPPGGTVLDPFAGSGTTGSAAVAQNFNAILIEREAEYVDDILDRFGWDYWE